MTIASPTLAWPVDARPRVRVAGQFQMEAKGFPFVYRSPSHALHLHGYDGTIRLMGRDYPLAPGVMTLSPAGLDSSYDLPRPGTHWCIHLDIQPVRHGEVSVRLPVWQPLGDLQMEAARRFAHIARLHATAQQRHRPRNPVAAAIPVALQELLLWTGLLEQPGLAPAGDRPDPVDHVMSLVQRELHLPLCVPDLARRVHMSQNYLARRFRQRTGTTIPRYILLSRIESARLLLTTTDLPVKEIAARVGMPDPQHFNKQFRHIAGCSPSAARRRA